MFGVIAAQQRQFECVRQILDRHDTDGSGDAGKGMRRSVHFVRCRSGLVFFEDRELALQGGQVSARFLVEDFGQFPVDRKLCAGGLCNGGDLSQGVE